MRTWKITPKDPLSLTLAADSRLTELDYTNDQIWELLPVGGEPASILLQTSYGLRARNMRIFLQFEEAHKVVRDPHDFAGPLNITHFAPNYVQMYASPFPGLDVILEYWVPDCQTVAGRIRIENTSRINRNLRFEVCALLTPNDAAGQPMYPDKIEVANVLVGKTEKISPVLFVTGGASSISSPYPALSHNLSLLPGQSRRFTWVLASHVGAEQSFRHARLTASLNFDSQISQIDMLSSRQMEIYTGNPDWDLAFAMGKKNALGLVHSRNKALKHSSFVSTRLPDQGYSPAGSGADYTHLWNGQTAFETWYLIQYLLPEHPEIAKGFLFNFINTQQENGFIDFKPGLAGQISGILASPLLVSSAWEIYQATLDQKFLEKVFSPLHKFTLSWFDRKQDRDRDGIPEWVSSIQSGFDENPSFSPWLEWAQGADISTVESPDLCAYLYRELQLLIQIAHLLNRPEVIPPMAAISEKLQAAVQSSWNSRRASYQYRDRDSHCTYKRKLLKSGSGSGAFSLKTDFDQPTRLLARLSTAQSPPPKVSMTIHGRTENGKNQAKKISIEPASWVQGSCIQTIPDLYLAVNKIDLTGLPDDGKFSFLVIDHTLEDHTLLTPIWAGIPTADQVEKLIKRKLGNPSSYFRGNGIPACPKKGKKHRPGLCDFLWLPWNVFIGEGLLNYGKQSEVIDLLTRIMEAIVQNLKSEHAFRTNYHAELPMAAGQRGSLIGLPPVGLFLKALGVRPISPWMVEVTNHNPFPWEVRVKYKGMHIQSTGKAVTVTFPDGEVYSVDGEIPCRVEHNPPSEIGDSEGV
jgi:hypothetical protein